MAGCQRIGVMAGRGKPRRRLHEDGYGTSCGGGGGRSAGLRPQVGDLVLSSSSEPYGFVDEVLGAYERVTCEHFGF